MLNRIKDLQLTPSEKKIKIEGWEKRIELESKKAHELMNQIKYIAIVTILSLAYVHENCEELNSNTKSFFPNTSQIYIFSIAIPTLLYQLYQRSNSQGTIQSLKEKIYYTRTFTNLSKILEDSDSSD